jgi:dipeptidyl-peptidase-4
MLLYEVVSPFRTNPFLFWDFIVIRILPLVLIFLMTPLLSGQQPSPPAKLLGVEFLREYAETRGYLLGRPSKMKFSPDNRSLLYLRSGAKKSKLSLYELDLKTQQEKLLLSPETVLKGAEENLTPEEKARRERMRLSTGGFSDYQLTEDGKQILVPLSGKLYLFHRETEKIRELKTGKGTLLDPKLSPDGSKVAYVLNYDLFVYDLAKDQESPVTTGGSEIKTHALAEFVAQEEMARFSGYWWSPDGNFFAYEEADHEGVEQWFVADPTKPAQTPLPQYYPRPGKKNVSVKLGVIPVTGGTTAWVEWDRTKFEYLAAVKWDKHGGLTVQLQDRKQQILSLNRVDPKTGKLSELLEVKDPAWVNLLQAYPVWREEGDFLFPKLHSGFEDLHLRGSKTETRLWHNANPNSFSEFISYDAKKKQVWFLCDETNGLPQLSQVRLDEHGNVKSGGDLAGAGEGVRGVVFSKDHSLLAVTTSTLTHLPRTTIYDAKFDKLAEVPSAAMEPSFKPKSSADRLEDYHCMIVRPHDFDPKKKYPVIVDVYGGPHHIHVPHAMRNWLLPQWLADQGFVVVAIDNRGIPGRGREWERSIYQKFGTVPLEGQVEGLKALGKKYPELDLDRIGIVGWSFGGYMSALAVLKRPDIFKAAVAGAPVTDWEDYDTHYTERYMGLLPESRRAYDEGSLLPLAPKLSRPLLLVHGTADDNVYFRHTLRLTDALFRAGRDFEVLPLPSLTHMVRDPEVTERLWTRIVKHFQKHLK